MTTTTRKSTGIFQVGGQAPGHDAREKLGRNVLREFQRPQSLKDVLKMPFFNKVVDLIKVETLYGEDFVKVIVPAVWAKQYRVDSIQLHILL
jgi:hypothetical protein